MSVRHDLPVRPLDHAMPTLVRLGLELMRHIGRPLHGHKDATALVAAPCGECPFVASGRDHDAVAAALGEHLLSGHHGRA